MSGTVGTPTGLNAMDEVRKWAISELRGDLKNNVGGKLTQQSVHVEPLTHHRAAEEFVNTLFSLPPEIEILVEGVHSATQTTDSRHFSEEFLRV